MCVILAPGNILFNVGMHLNKFQAQEQAFLSLLHVLTDFFWGSEEAEEHHDPASKLHY